MNFFISEALAEAPAAAPQGGFGGLEGLLFPIGLILILYFLMIRPQMKRQKEHRKMLDSLAKGDEVATDGGLLGKISELGDNFAQLEIAEGVQVKIRRQAVAQVLPKGSLKEL